MTSTAAASTSAIVGDWIRIVSCQEMLAAFVQAGLNDQVQQWVVGNFVGDGATTPPGDFCAATKAVEHSHFFTADGRFGSRDANGQQVDEGDWVLVDRATLSFPSHAADFGYAGDLSVHFAIANGKLTFTVTVPSGCTAACRVAYGWAMSAFYGPRPFERK